MFSDREICGLSNELQFEKLRWKIFNWTAFKEAGTGTCAPFSLPCREDFSKLAKSFQNTSDVCNKVTH